MLASFIKIKYYITSYYTLKLSFLILKIFFNIAKKYCLKSLLSLITLYLNKITLNNILLLVLLTMLLKIILLISLIKANAYLIKKIVTITKVLALQTLVL